MVAHLEANDSMPDGSWVASDDAYVAGRRMPTPWPGRNLAWEKDAYN